MKKVILKSILIIFIFLFNGFAQPQPFRGALLFNLIEKENSKNLITPEELETKNIRFLSSDKESELKYDATHKAFSFSTDGFEHKELAIIYNNDTIFINYPSLPFLKSVFVKTPIPLNGESFSFSNKYTYDAIHSNKYYNSFRTFYLCQGCSLSFNYSMSEDRKKHLRKELFSHLIKLEK